MAVVIAPWNFPLAILGGMTAAALVTGNTVDHEAGRAVVGHGGEADGGLPGGRPAAGRRQLPARRRRGDRPDAGRSSGRGRDRLHRLAQVGLLINAEAGKTPPGQDHVKRVIAEMGGKNAIIVDDDADLDEAVQGVVDGAFGYSGQKCSACSRAIVLESVYDQFLHRLVEATQEPEGRPGRGPGCAVGPVIDEEARQAHPGVHREGQEGSAAGLCRRCRRPGEAGHFVAPHIFADVSPNATIAQEEIFGPVLAVIKVKDLDEALEIANGTQVRPDRRRLRRSPENIAAVKRRFRVGNLYINRKITGALVGGSRSAASRCPASARRPAGRIICLQFVLPRTITENTLRRGFAPEAAKA